MAPSSVASRARALLAVGLVLLLLGACSAKKEGLTEPSAGTPSPTSVYAQGDGALPAQGISVSEPKTLDEQVQEEVDELDDYGETEAATIADPLEKWNRFWFRFNDWVYVHVADPVYGAWKAAIPQEFRSGLHNFYHNLLFPLRFVNNLLQAKFLAAGVEFSRFVGNSTAGLGGFFDVTRNNRTIVPVHPEGEDFGQTLGAWGIGQGCYIVWPFLGPSTVRETVGRVGDAFAKPAFAASFVIDPWYLPPLVQLGFDFNDLDDVLPTYMELRKAAVDPYIMMREAYVKMRATQVER